MLKPTKYRGNNLKIASTEALSIERIFRSLAYRGIMAVLTTLSIFDRKGCSASGNKEQLVPAFADSLCVTPLASKNPHVGQVFLKNSTKQQQRTELCC